MKSALPCPMCHNPLDVIHTPHGVILYCAIGRCASQAANDGASGETEVKAHIALRDLIESEQDARAVVPDDLSDDYPQRR